MIKVIFRKDKKSGEIIAILPQIAGDRFWSMTCTSYAHMGQHGTTSFNYYYEGTRPATVQEFWSLFEEMQQIYDGQLQISHRLTYADEMARRSMVKAGRHTD